jgi:hypothetical protein
MPPRDKEADVKELPDYSGDFDPDLKLQDFSKDALIRLLVATGKLYVGVDPIWLATMRQIYGDRVAFDYDKQVWQAGTESEVHRVTKALNITGNDVAAVFKFFQFSPGFGALFDIDWDLKDRNHGIMTVTRCLGVVWWEKTGDEALQKFTCEELEIPLFQRIAEHFNPKMKATALKLPPRDSVNDIACRWEFKIE